MDDLSGAQHAVVTGWASSRFWGPDPEVWEPAWAWQWMNGLAFPPELASPDAQSSALEKKRLEAAVAEHTSARPLPRPTADNIARRSLPAWK